ncbi:MAG: hypothetical protein M1820_009542 [Bogoriella megaspora]|nr:MAG: hypothetical protein M1820_009542 [Bogoriella megaspora]
MSFATMRNLLVASLVAGSVNALPQASSSSTTNGSATSTEIVPTATVTSPALKKLSQELADAPTVIDRFTHLLGLDGTPLTPDEIQQRVVFDFNVAPPNPGAKAGRGAYLANRANFPILTGTGISWSNVFFDPCGLVTPHIHPRADEFLMTTEGTVETGMYIETGFETVINATLPAYQGTVFPRGTLHYIQNPTCDPAATVAAFNSEDPGQSIMAQGMFALDPNVVDAVLGFPEYFDPKNIDSFRASLPVSVALGIEECLTRCNIAKN